ncbi:flavin monoamine oxidase family protein [Streptomyces sp. NPDC057424]|uniref:flavin monoamine oxidase family protein n=1 Tax=Streptomyces sp. NPDC057424 TaxID=3346127 RepID=UPI0036CAE012
MGVAVVGAGVGGSYAAYRLAASAGLGHLPVALFERSHRIGGRVWSTRVGPAPGAWADLGAMHLHWQLRSVMALVHHLGLGEAVVPFDFGRGENLTHLRATALHQRELVGSAHEVPYRLRAAEQGRSPDALAALAVERTLAGFSRLRRLYHHAAEQGRWREAGEHARAYRLLRDSTAVDGRPVRTLDCAAVLMAGLSREAIRFLDDAGGYDASRTGGNAADWLDVLFHTPVDADYVTLSGGMQRLPSALHARFSAAGGHTHLGHRLTRVDQVVHEGGHRPTYELTFTIEDRLGRPTGTRVRVGARKVLLAMPQGALCRLDRTTWLFTPQLLADLDSVEAVAALKLFLAYPEAWWLRMGLSSGRSTTDLPLRQLWYGGAERDGSVGRGGGPALLLAAYPTGPSAAYWDRFLEGPRFPEPHPAARAEDTPRPSAAMVEHAQGLLCTMHGMHEIPAPVSACWQHWNLPPHDGAWHVWKPGRDSRSITRRMRAPALGHAVHIVSDCWTSDPGSIPGTLGCAERVLQDHLGLAPPPWLRPQGSELPC